jgi:Flp pilus assembly protein TadD
MGGYERRAVEILERGYAMYPDRVSILNNLVYSLANSPQTLARARGLLPKLLEMDSESFAVFDTAAVVYLRSGQLDQAKVHIKKALELLSEDEYSAMEVRLHEAEIQFRSGEYRKARKSLQALREDPRRSAVVDREALALLRQLDRTEGEW